VVIDQVGVHIEQAACVDLCQVCEGIHERSTANPVSYRLHIPLEYRRDMKDSRTYQEKREKCEKPTHFFYELHRRQRTRHERTPQGERNDVEDRHNASNT